MKQYFESLGWVFNGMCGCSENKGIYTNPQYPNWQLWIAVSGVLVQFKKIYGNSLDPTRKGTAGTHNYQQAYEYWVLNDRD